MDSWVKDLKYILMPSRHAVKGFEKEYNDAYRVWRAAWEKYRTELGITQKLNSDGFLLPDEMGVLFYQDECVGFTSFTHGQMNGPVEDLNWFNGWTAEAVNDLRKISQDVVVCSQFTINPKFTGKGHIVRWKEIVSLYSLLRFDHSDAGVMAGQLNLIRGMQNASGETFGATVLKPYHEFNYSGLSLPIQLVAYERHNIQAMIEKKELAPLCNDLWAKLIHVTEFKAGKTILPFRKVA